jgi:2-keto-4-pentenoate hydratase
MTDNDPIASFADALIAAHRNKTLIPASQAPVLADLAAGFEVQSRVARGLGATIAGWKVPRAPDGTRVAAPFYKANCVPSGSPWPMRTGGLIFEIELAFELERDLPPRPGKPYSREEVIGAIGDCLIGIEMVGSRIDNPDGLPFATLLGDNHGCAGYVTGSRVADWRKIDFRKLRCVAKIGGETVFDKVDSHPQKDPLLSLVEYAGVQADRLGGLRAGQIVTTGSMSGVTKVDKPCLVEGEISEIGNVEVRIVAG